MLARRTRAALEREKTLVLRSIKELEFDRGMGKVSEKDFAEMSARLRARAARLMRQLDAGSLYREQIEKEIAQRLAKTRSRPQSGEGPLDERLRRLCAAQPTTPTRGSARTAAPVSRARHDTGSLASW